MTLPVTGLKFEMLEKHLHKIGPHGLDHNTTHFRNDFQ